MREGVHPEVWFRRRPITLGWELIGVIDVLGAGVQGLQPGMMVSALPVVGSYAEYICLPQQELVPVPDGLDPLEAVCMVFNYTTAFQMLHRSASVTAGHQILIHSAAGGIGTALLQLGKIASLEMFGTASAAKHDLVAREGGIPIDYRIQDFVQVLQQCAPQGMHAVFDGIGGRHLSHSFETLRPGGSLIAFGLTSSLRSRRQTTQALSDFIEWARILGLNFNLQHKRVRIYSVQSLKRLHPDWFRQDLSVLFELLSQMRLKPVIAKVFPLEKVAEAHRLLESGMTTGKILLTCSS
jgi:NADPH2:quinone reductase